MSTLFKTSLLIAIVILASGFIFLYSRMNFLEKNVLFKDQQLLATPKTQVITNKTLEPLATPIITVSGTCDADCKEYIKLEIAKAVKTPTSTTVTQAVSKSKQTTYVPLSGVDSTTSTDWTDVEGALVSIDVANDYNKDAYITWEASLKIANANGLVYARLFDVTNGIAVSNSEINVNSGVFTNVVSGKLNLWSGKNTYKVQIKSQTSQEAIFGSGRIKVVY